MDFSDFSVLVQSFGDMIYVRLCVRVHLLGTGLSMYYERKCSRGNGVYYVLASTCNEDDIGYK